MKTVLIPAVNNPEMRSVLETAFLLARAHGSYIEGFALQSWIDPEAIAAGSTGPSGSRVLAYEDAGECRVLFKSIMGELGVPESNKLSPVLSFGWSNEVSEGEAFVGSHARVFDLTVMSRVSLDPGGLYARAIEIVLTESGRPLVLSPPSAPAEIGTNILVIWNGYIEQARAIALGMPLLRQARRVIILSGLDRTIYPEKSGKLIRYLKYNSVNAEAMNLNRLSKHSGREIAAIANATDCNLLIAGLKGRYGMRWLGGDSVINWLAKNTDVPLFLAN